ncbi:RNA-binding ATPase activator esf2 [Actinomortierella wolfii]|nr:RNA-binding ATPase activator esf2 [Actinomortierella wolfii]
MGTKAEHYKEIHQSDSEADSPGYDSDDQQNHSKTKASKVKGKAAKAKAKSAASAKGRRATFDAFAKSDDSDDDSDAGSSEEEEENQEEEEGGDDAEEDDEDDNEEDAENDVEDAENDAKSSSDPRFQLDMSDDGGEDNEATDNMDQSNDGKSDEEDTKTKSKKDKKKKVKPLTPEELAKFQAAYEKTGIVYISRIPPFMKPVKIRHLLSRFGEIGRVYLAPEDPKVAARRKKYGGNKKQNFTEGWVEFKDKAVAKTVAKTLNTTIIGGKKNSHYHDDIWNIKYLPKFKWNHLTERIAYENASRAQRLQAEISQAKRENKAILANIEKSKMIQSIEEKKAAKRKAAGGEEAATEKAATGSDDKSNMANIRRAFKQRKLETTKSPKTSDSKVQSVLSSVFGR